MEILLNLDAGRPGVSVVLFDFDGTLSTLRHGWERIMKPFMLEMIAGDTQVDDALVREVESYIDQSTGIQTIHQMKWLSDEVRRYGRNPGAPEDPWWYKAEYNRRLMVPVAQRTAAIVSGRATPDDYLIKGSVSFLQALVERGVEVFVASGTDDPDVKREAELLGVRRFFKDISGAPPGKTDCSKEAVLRKLFAENSLQGPEVAVIGDGRVEIALGRQAGTMTIGLASNEETRSGVNPVKRDRLVKAGAHMVIGDFAEKDELLAWLGV